MACVATLCLLDITWRRRCKAAPYGGSYARWRELPALGFRLICSGGGLAAVLMQHWLGSREAEPSDAGSGGSGVGSGVLPAVRDVVLLLFVSGLPAALQAWTWPLRIRWGTLAPCSPAYPPTAHSPALLLRRQAAFIFAFRCAVEHGCRRSTCNSRRHTLPAALPQTGKNHIFCHMLPGGCSALPCSLQHTSVHRDPLPLRHATGIQGCCPTSLMPKRTPPCSLAAPAHMAASVVVVRRTRAMCASLEAVRPRAAHMAAQVARLLQQLRFTSFSPLTQAPAEVRDRQGFG